MGEVYIYDRTAGDVSTLGLCGALCPIECTHDETAGGESALTLVHPFDPDGRWRHIVRGNVLKADVRVRTVPEIVNGQTVTTYEVWTVKSTATKNGRKVYSKSTGGRVKNGGDALPAGTQVNVFRKGDKRYKIRATVRKKGKSVTVSGWIALDALEFTIKETLPDGDIESICPPWIVKPQLFRILRVESDAESGTITAYAPHISYDMAGDLTTYKTDEPVDALTALNGIADGRELGGDGIELYTDMADERTGCDWENVSPVQALLDPENGFLARWGAELVRDDESLYFLRRAGRDRGVRIEHGKNLLGARLDIDDDGVITHIKPTGTTKNGKTLYLTDDAASADNYVVSSRAGEYAAPRAALLACDGAKVTDKVSKTLARARMREQAQRMFDDDQVDLPRVSLTVDFVELGDTVEYRQYRELERVYLYDTVPVVDKRHGIEVTADVHRTQWDCLTGRIIQIELGDVRRGVSQIMNFQIASLDGGKLLPGSVDGTAIEDGGIPEDKLDAELRAALALARADIDSARTLLDDTRQWLDGVEATTEALETAVADTAGNIAAIRQAADEIRAGLASAQDDLAAVSLRADQLQTAISNAQGDISTLRQTASGLSSSVSSLSGDVSALRQTSSSLSSTVATLDGQVQTLIQQTANQVAVMLKDESVDATFTARVGKRTSQGLYETAYGIELTHNGLLYGGLYTYPQAQLMRAPLLVLDSKYDMDLWAGDAGVYLFTNEDGNPIVQICATTLLPLAPYSAQPNLGANSTTGRWRNIYLANNPNVSSDRRLKTDIVDLDAAAALIDRLRPRAFRRKDDPDKLHWGFIAQEAREALREMGVGDAALVDAENPESLAIVYGELIAPLVAKVQAQQRRIDALEARLKQLEERL